MLINYKVVELLCKIGLHPFKKYISISYRGNKKKEKYVCRGCNKPIIKNLIEITEKPIELVEVSDVRES